jgi:predicted HAD superfamily Cof-like phosphohydrolase
MTTENNLLTALNTMHTKFGIDYNGPPRHLPYEEKAFRIAAMQEELNEYAEADTLVEQYDALLDLIVFAVGSLDKHGFPLQSGFDAVMACNLAKEVGQNGNKRGGFKTDLVKPEGWKGPEDTHTQILVQRTLEMEQ